MKTDAQLQQDVMALTGTVHSWAERELARHAAWGAAGVRSVIDKMNLVA